MQASSRSTTFAPLAEPVLSATDSREVFRELLIVHARTLQRAPALHLMIIATIVFGCRAFVPATLLYGWAVTYLVAECVRAAVAHLVLRRIAVLDPYRTHRLFVALAACSGMVAGSSSLLILPSLPVLLQGFLVASMFLLIACAGSVSSSTQTIYLAHTVALLTLVVVGWSNAYPEYTWVAIVKAIGYTAYVMSVARDGERSLLRSLAIRRERDRTAVELHRRNDDVRDALHRAEQAAASRSRVLATASHDLRQPMHALSLYSAILAEKPGAATLQEVGHDIQQIIQSLGNLLDGLLDLSQLSSEHYAPDLKVFRVDEVVQVVCSEYRPRAAAKGLVLHEQMASVRLLGDPMAVGRITRNLVDNAIKYTERGSVTVTVGSLRGEVILSIEDSGVGISQADQSNIFEEFYQVDDASHARHEGVGLGLAIVHRLCLLMQARIDLRSRPGAGTRFDISIPGRIDTIEPDAGSAVVESDARAPLRGQRLYIVDDERDIRLSMQALLKHWGADVHIADGAASLEALFENHGRPQLLITDLRLGETEHGATLTTRLRTRYGRFAVLIMTGETSSASLREANQAGYPLLQKPISADRLRQAIDSLLPTASTSAPPHDA